MSSIFISEEELDELKKEGGVYRVTKEATLEEPKVTDMSKILSALNQIAHGLESPKPAVAVVSAPPPEVAIVVPDLVAPPLKWVADVKRDSSPARRIESITFEAPDTPVKVTESTVAPRKWEADIERDSSPSQRIKTITFNAIT